jgi:hypothetical protein
MATLGIAFLGEMRIPRVFYSLSLFPDFRVATTRTAGG